MSNIVSVFILGLAAPSTTTCTEFKARPLPLDPAPRAGTIRLSPGERLSAERLDSTLRADAAGLLRRSDGGAGLSVRREAVSWRDGSLGCPSRDRMYTPAPVEGWRVVVSDGPNELDYHVSADGRWLLCPADRSEPPLSGSRTH